MTASRQRSRPLAAGWAAVLKEILRPEDRLTKIPEIVYETIFYLGAAQALRGARKSAIAETEAWFSALDRDSLPDSAPQSSAESPSPSAES